MARVRIGTCALGVAALLEAGSAMAQSDRERRSLIERAEHHYERGRYDRALTTAMRAAELGMSPSLRFFIAVQHQALGHTLDALDGAERCAQEAAHDASISDRDELVARCNRLASLLEASVARVQIRVPDRVPESFHVNIQGGEIDRARWSAPIAVLPGRIVVEGRLPESPSLREEFDLAAGQRREVSFERFFPAPPVASTPAPTADGHVETPVATPVARPPIAPTLTASPLIVRPQAERGPGAAPWIVAGAGAVILGGAGAFYTLREADVAERDRLCGTPACTADQETDARSLDDRARTWNTLTNVSLGVGAAAVVGGLTWWFFARPSSPPRVSAWISPREGSFVAGLGGAL